MRVANVFMDVAMQISMMDGELFDKLERIAQEVRAMIACGLS